MREKDNMPKVCVYVLDHDYGNGKGGIRIKSGKIYLEDCKKSTIEKGAEKGDLIFCIGGKRLGKIKDNQGKYYQKFIYAMKVQETRPPMSKDFCFLGDKAIDIPKELLSLIFDNGWVRKGAKYIDEPHFSKFEKFVEKQGKGKIGEHCDMKNKNY